MTKTLALMSALLALALAPCSSAQAAGPAQRAYALSVTAGREVMSVSTRQVQARIVKTQEALTPCLKSLIALLADRSDETQAKALLGEIGAQFAFSALWPVLSPVVHEFVALLKIPGLTAKQLSIFREPERLLEGLASLNACADAERWQRAGFAASAEPAGTKFAQHPDVPASANLTQVWPFSAAERRVLAVERARAVAHIKELTKVVNVAAEAWVERTLRLP